EYSVFHPLSLHDALPIYHRLVTMEYSNNGRVAGLIETPAPGVHEVVGGVQVLMGRGFAGDHPEKSFWKGAYIPGREVSACAAERSEEHTSELQSRENIVC